MKNFLIALMLFLVWSFFGLWLYNSFQDDKKPDLDAKATEIQLNNNSIPVTEVPEKSNTLEDSIFNAKKSNIANLKVVDEKGATLFSFPEGISAKKNTVDLKLPSEIDRLTIKLAEYLINHPSNKLSILSKYSPSEKALEPNFGEQRGDFVKQILIKAGIPSSLILIKPIIWDLENKNGSFYENIISFAFEPMSLDDMANETSALSENQVFYPQFSNALLQVNEPLKKLGKEIFNFIASNENAVIAIIGHTDGVGNDNDNFRVGLRNANSIKWYLVHNLGIKTKNIKTYSKGETQPIVANDTEKNRKRNNRIEIEFIK